MTSLIPTIVALSSFFIENFPHISWYPYWYLGNPYQFLIGPVVPTILAIFNFSFGHAQGGQFSIFNSYLGLIFVSFLIGAFGIYLFLREWGVRKREAALSGIFYLVFPAGVFLLSYQNGLNHIALGFLPYILLLYRRFLQRESFTIALFLSLAICFVILIDISILLPLLIGFVSLFISQEVKKDLEDKAIKTILILALSVFLSTIWYTPRFWWVVFSNPSFGGASLFNVATSIFKLLLNLVPIVLAVLVARLGKLKTTGYLPFATLFFASFLFLTIIRFLSDPDFIVDWVGFGLELQFGMAIILGSILGNFKSTSKILKLFPIYSLVIIFSTAASFYILKGWIASFQVDYQRRIVSTLNENVKENERVFLSGSPVFFINSKLTIQQVRGGVDQASVNPFWAKASYQIREGTSNDLSHAWLSILGASYVLVHGLNSKEPFHDFKHPEKFTNPQVNAYFERIDIAKGDTLYKVGGALIARVANQSLLLVPPPRNGADRQTIFSYEKDIKKPLDYRLKKDGIEVAGKISSDEVVSLAITYSPDFKVVQGEGRVVSDSIGNMIIIPKRPGEQRFILQYQQALADYLTPLLASGILGYILIFYDIVIRKINRFIPKLHPGLEEEY